MLLAGHANAEDRLAIDAGRVEDDGFGALGAAVDAEE